ncbi:putative PB1 domain-containing protein [Dioscorea sansibarensis]
MDPSSAVGVGSGGVVVGYADSVDSSPRSRGGESWDEPFPSTSPAPKLRLMCSYGGHIVPRPTDKSLCYLGGETRIVVVDRHSTLSDLSARLSRSLLGNRPFTLKYQLPNEDLDSLISVTTDEDLDNMIEEYDRLLLSNPNPSRSSRIRLFLFPSKPDSAPSSIGSLLDDSKSETWFVDALNNTISGGLPRGLSADSASVNCLLGLEDDSSTHSRAGGAPPPDPDHLMLHRPDSSGRLPSVPDSPMLETTSSFGSASSAPSLSNLPPIRVRPEDRPPDPRIVGLDDHFSQINISNAPPQQPPPPQPSFPLPSTAASPPTISPTENPNRVFSDDERSEKSDHSGVRRAPPQAHQHPQAQQTSIPESMPRTIYAANPVAEAKREVPISDQSYRIPPLQQPLPPQQIQASDQSYIMPSIPTDHTQQFITTGNPHYLHHPATGTAVPIQSYYHLPPSLQQSQQHHHFDPQISMYQYYVPVRPNPAPPLTNPQIPAARPMPAATAAAAATRGPIIPAGMGYHMVPQQAPAMPNYAAYDPSMYYTPTSAPPPQMLQAQYQPVSLAEAQSPPADARPTRAS